MKIRSEIHQRYKALETELNGLIARFDSSGEAFLNQDRNELKRFSVGDTSLIVKSFKPPNFINKFVYRFIRKSKANRSFLHACKLQSLEIGTPAAVAFYEFGNAMSLKRSYYISEKLDYDLTYRELTRDLNYPDHETILRAFTRFTHQLHEKGVNFLDHSPGNTLIKKHSHGYEFYLVDLNRMEFESLSMDRRIRNFERLTAHESLVRIMSDEYAKCIDESAEMVFDKMWTFTQAFQKRFHSRQRLKKRLKFWKSSGPASS